MQSLFTKKKLQLHYFFKSLTHCESPDTQIYDCIFLYSFLAISLYDHEFGIFGKGGVKRSSNYHSTGFVFRICVTKNTKKIMFCCCFWDPEE